jgi:uncharacterized membrane protein YphA (DoxX/SURF4 family)
MSVTKTLDKLVINNYILTFALRLLLGGVFLVFGASKIPHLDAFTGTVLSYNVLPEPYARAYGTVLPWAEVITGACLIAGLGLKIFPLAAISMAGTFITATSVNLYWLKTGIPDCGCLGGVSWPLSWLHLLIQIILLVIASQVWLHHGNFLSMDSYLSCRFHQGRSSSEGKHR